MLEPSYTPSHLLAYSCFMKEFGEVEVNARSHVVAY